VRRLAVIQDEICCRAFCKWLMLELKSDGWKERKSCVSSVYRWWFKERDETGVLSGVVYMTKSRGPRTEPWGDTTEASMWGGEITIAFDTKTARWKIGSEPESSSYTCNKLSYSWVETTRITIRSVIAVGHRPLSVTLIRQRKFYVVCGIVYTKLRCLS